MNFSNSEVNTTVTMDSNNSYGGTNEKTSSINVYLKGKKND